MKDSLVGIEPDIYKSWLPWKVPLIFGLIRLHGVNEALLRRLGEAAPDNVRIQMRVKDKSADRPGKGSGIPNIFGQAGCKNFIMENTAIIGIGMAAIETNTKGDAFAHLARVFVNKARDDPRFLFKPG